MRLMRHKRSGRLVVYDESLLPLGTYEIYDPPRPGAEDEVGATDDLEVVVTRGERTTHAGE